MVHAREVERYQKEQEQLRIMEAQADCLKEKLILRRVWKGLLKNVASRKKEREIEEEHEKMKNQID